ncbi:MAG: DUF3054 domain-containing protein [Actinomycetota bacterium]|nr:DUF3054 domain-containing protein [Actinomycetota bacterium]
MRTLGAVLADAVSVVVFVAIGRDAHHHVVGVAGIASTAWPFLAGVAVGWAATAAVAARGRRRLGLVSAGLVVWPVTVAVGMVLRVMAGQGTEAAFVAVALAFVGLFLLGWRLAALVAVRVRRPPAQAGAGVEMPTPPRVSEP